MIAAVAAVAALFVAFFVGDAVGSTTASALTKVVEKHMDIPAGSPAPGPVTNVNAVCPRGRQVTGGGYSADPRTTQFYGTGPSGIDIGRRGAKGAAHEWTALIQNTGTGATTLSVYAVCIRKP